VGRGLSELQKRILRVVYERRQGRDFDQEERDWHERAANNPYMQGIHYWVRFDIRHPEIIAALYDWPRYWARREGRYIRPSEGAHVADWGQNWHRDVVGQAEYNRKTASYYRAVSRLKRRGLLAERGAGLWITDEGQRVVADGGKVINLKDKPRPDYDVYIGRRQWYGKELFEASPWANYYSWKRYGRAGAIARYEQKVRNSPELMARIPELDEKTLGCWCKPQACHGDVLLRLVEEQRRVVSPLSPVPIP
jgi:hypothetical protein